MKIYVKSSHTFSNGWYFGKDEYELCGSLISELCKGWIISKRIAHCDAGEEFSLQGVADLLQRAHPEFQGGKYTLKFGNGEQEEDFSLYTILGALEGMCHNNEACEVADGFYYVGSYADWKNDVNAQNRLEELLEAERT